MSETKSIGNLLANLYSFVGSGKPSDSFMLDHTKGETINTDHYFQKEDYGHTVNQKYIPYSTINRAFIPDKGPFIDKPTFDLNINPILLEHLLKHEDLFKLHPEENRLGRVIVLPDHSDPNVYLAMNTLDSLMHKVINQD